MTDQQINTAIAEVCGWKIFSKPLSGFGFAAYAKSPNGDPNPGIPDYCNDLNAMAEAEKTIFPYYATVYSNKLAKVTGAEMSDDTDYFCATARQRAEAFLLTLGKWSATDKDSLTVQPTTEESSVDREEVQG